MLSKHNAPRPQSHPPSPRTYPNLSKPIEVKLCYIFRLCMFGPKTLPGRSRLSIGSAFVLELQVSLQSSDCRSVGQASSSEAPPPPPPVWARPATWATLAFLATSSRLQAFLFSTCYHAVLDPVRVLVVAVAVVVVVVVVVVVEQQQQQDEEE